MRLGGAAGQLGESREPKRREQLEAARSLLLRNSDGGPEGFLGGGGIGRIAFQQNVAAQTIEVGLCPSLQRRSTAAA